jgi:hypothetical protein
LASFLCNLCCVNETRRIKDNEEKGEGDSIYWRRRR